MKTTPTSMQQEFKELFQTLTPKQIWLVVKLCKYVRLRARNNIAFNNLFNTVFPDYTFKQITKTRADGSSYPGLSILGRATGISVGEEEESEE